LKERFRKLFTNVWNIPNALTMLRLVLIPVFVVVFFNTPREQDKVAAFIIFAVASITDMFDGMLARKLNQITDFGKLFDPLADKVMVVTAMVCQAIIGVFPWVAIIIVAAKELVMLFGGMFMLSKGVVVYSNYWGKTAQVFFIASLILSFFHPSLVAGNICVFGLTVDLLLLWITVALAIAALVVYAMGAAKTLKAKKQNP
jgi:CDP-diacylglycerol--glycerol-3-phosphate 3-phosphatidyltransferase